MQELKDLQIKLCIGYCGWNANELEAEIEEGSWIITKANVSIVFTANTQTIWNELYETCK
jgi:putative transcriptional regulator